MEQKKKETNNYPWLDEYLLSKAGADKSYKAEWDWLRYLVGGKMFAAVCTPDIKHKEHNGRTMVILKCEPMTAELFRSQYDDIVPGFYSDKANWNTVYLDGTVPDSLMKEMCDISYSLVFNKLTKTLQREITGQNNG